jgi:hypothetical protein
MSRPVRCSMSRPVSRSPEGKRLDRRAFLNCWHRATGLHRGKSCQLDSKLAAPGFAVALVHQTEATNHKGKA